MQKPDPLEVCASFYPSEQNSTSQNVLEETLTKSSQEATNLGNFVHPMLARLLKQKKHLGPGPEFQLQSQRSPWVKSRSKVPTQMTVAGCSNKYILDIIINIKGINGNLLPLSNSKCIYKNPHVVCLQVVKRNMWFFQMKLHTMAVAPGYLLLCLQTLCCHLLPRLKSGWKYSQNKLNYYGNAW